MNTLKSGWGVAFLASGLLFLASPVLVSESNPARYEGGRSGDVMLSMERNSSAAARLLGELRTSSSDIMFIKTERYLHNGIGYTAHMNDTAIRNDEGDSHAGTATLIPSAETDFRGFVGHLEREIKPWQDPNLPHVHAPGTELLPWYRMMTLSDPYCVRCYLIGAFWLKTIDPLEGKAFLLEGIDNNPEAFQLHYMLGQVYRELAKGETTDSDSELELQVLALEAFRKGAQYAVAARYDGPFQETNAQWGDYLEDDARGACRLHVLMEDKYGDPSVALRKASEYLEKFGGEDLPLQSFIRRKTAGEN